MRKLSKFDEEHRRLISANTDKRYFTRIPVLPDEVDEKKTRLHLATKIQRVPNKASK